MNLGKVSVPKTPAAPAIPKAPDHAGTSFSEGPASGSAGIGAPKSFDPNNPSVHVSGTIHNPTGIGGDLKVDRDVAIPKNLPDVSVPDLGLGAGKSSGGGGGFGLPSMPNLSAPDLSMPGMPSMPDLPSMPGLPSMPNMSMPDISMPSMPGLPNMPSIPGLSMPSVPGLSMPSLPSIGTPGMPGFRFLDLPEFDLPDLDMGAWDLSMPDLIPDWGGDSEDSEVQPHKRLASSGKLQIELTLATEDGDALPWTTYLLKNDDDWKLAGSFGKESKAAAEIPKGDFSVLFGATASITACALGRKLKKAMAASDRGRVMGALAAYPSHLREIEKVWPDLEAGDGKTFSMGIRSLFSGTPEQNLAEILLSRGGLGGSSLVVYGIGASTPPPEYVVLSDHPSKVLAVGRKLNLQVREAGPGAAKDSPSSGSWIALRTTRLGEPVGKVVPGPQGGSWKDLVLDVAGSWMIVWTGPRPSESYVMEIRVVDKVDSAHALPLGGGSLNDPRWTFEAAKRFREIVHRIAEDHPPEDSKRAAHQREWDQLTAACERLAGSVGPDAKVSPTDAAILEPLLAGLKTPLREEPLSSVAWCHLFTTSEPPRLRLPAVQVRHHPDALTVAWHLAALSGKKDPVWKRGAKIKTDSFNGRFLGAVHNAEVQGVVVPENVFSDAKKIVELDSKTPCQKLTELLSLVSRSMTSSPIGTISIKGDSGDLDKLIHKTGMLSRDVKVSTWLDDLSDDDESFDWTQALRVDGSTKKRKHEIVASLTFVEAEPIGWNPDAVPLHERGPKGEAMIALVNHYLDSTANIEITWSNQAGESGKVTTDADGRFKLKIMPGLILLKYRHGNAEFCDQLFVVFDPVETVSGKWQRLSNLGYIHELLASNEPNESAIQLGLKRFSVDCGIELAQECNLLHKLAYSTSEQ